MGSTLKQKINERINLDGVKIKIDSISASPTGTIIYGTAANTVELVIDEILGERFRLGDFDIRLIANGQEVEYQGSGIRTDSKGMKFESRYDALPLNLENLKLNVKSFIVGKDVDEKIYIDKNVAIEERVILNQSIKITGLKEKSKKAYVDISTEENVVLTKVSLIIDGKKIGLKETINSSYDKMENGKIIHTRTLCFPETGENYELHIERISYKENLNEFINIPIS